MSGLNVALSSSSVRSLEIEEKARHGAKVDPVTEEIIETAEGTGVVPVLYPQLPVQYCVPVESAPVE